jgi:hypothetical protein
MLKEDNESRDLSDFEPLPDMQEFLSAKLPATESLPSYTASISRPPREKLTTVLKASERLIRETRHYKLPQPEEQGEGRKRRRLDSFVISLREERLGRRVIAEATPKRGSKLLAAIPAAVLARKPKLSNDNSPTDPIDVIISDQQGKSDLKTRKTRVIKMKMAPKLKKASIVTLNEQLDVKIKQQLNLTRGERQRQKDEAKQRQLERYKRQQEEMEQDEFGEEEEEDDFDERDLSEGDLGKGDLGKGDLGKGDLGKGDPEGGLVKRDLQSDEQMEHVKGDIKRRLLISDDEDVMEILDFDKLTTAPVALIVKPKSRAIILDEEQEQEDDDDDDDEEGLGHLIGTDDEEVSPSKVEYNSGLTQMLSGNFAESDDGQNIGTMMQVDDNSGSEDEKGFEKVFKARPKGEGFFDEEAEDEDSEISADDIDEEAIAKELQESAFLNDEEDITELDGSDQLAIHRQIQLAQDATEMEMFMNRFVPDKVLREMGPMADMRQKYADPCGEDERPTKSNIGRVKVIEAAASKSHPDFLKLIEQDMLISESDVETEEVSEASDLDGEGDKGRSESHHYQLSETLLTSSMVITSTHSATLHRRALFSIADDGLKARLLATGKEKDDLPTEQKRNRTTFETVSSRPVIAKEKMAFKK